MKGIGERIAEMTIDGNEYHPETIKKFRKFFARLPGEMQNRIIINGILNVLFEAFQGDRNLNWILEFMLENEKDRIKWKYYVRYA